MEYAAEIRRANLPRFGYASGDPGLSELTALDEDAPVRERWSSVTEDDAGSDE